jgi:hypothetical protein
VSKAIDLRICPHVCVEPGKLVGCRAAKRRTHDVFIRVQHGELTEEVLRFAEGVGRREQWRLARDPAGRIAAAN